MLKYQDILTELFIKKPMFKIFRKIRWKLLDKGSAKGYLAYAGGESVLILMGILIEKALSAGYEDILLLVGK